MEAEEKGDSMRKRRTPEEGPHSKGLFVWEMLICVMHRDKTEGG